MTKIDIRTVSKRPNYGTIDTNSPSETRILIEYNSKGHTVGIERGSLLLGFYIVLYVCFLVSGAAIFASLEAPKEMEIRGSLLKMRQEFLTRFPNVRDEDLETFIVEIVKASNNGVSAARNATGEPNWSFGQSIFFSTTVVTTIGYGHVTPLSRTGKMFCIFYAFVGIPLTLVLLTALVERLQVTTTWLLKWLHSKLGHFCQPFKIKLVHLAIVAAVMGSTMLVAPAGIFAAIEPDWDFWDAIYYCFISLTTIGLGDYIPGDTPDQAYRPLYKIATTCYLFIGITCMMLTLTVFYDIPQLNLGEYLKLENNYQIFSEKSENSEDLNEKKKKTRAFSSSEESSTVAQVHGAKI